MQKVRDYRHLVSDEAITKLKQEGDVRYFALQALTTAERNAIQDEYDRAMIGVKGGTPKAVRLLNRRNQRAEEVFFKFWHQMYLIVSNRGGTP